MNNKILLSVVIANYNYGRFLPAAIESVIQQCDSPMPVGGRMVLPVKNSEWFVELIVCDAASTDDSLDVIRKYEMCLSWWCSEKDGGQSCAFNKGFRRARGLWLTWLNADEEYLPGTFNALARKSEKNPNAEWITANHLSFNSDTRRIFFVTWGPHFQPCFFTRNRACLAVFGPSSFIRHDTYDRIGDINEEFHYSMDLEYWARLTLAGIRQTRLNCICWAFGVHADSKSTGSMTPQKIAKGHAENVAREQVLGYTYKVKFSNPWYVLWLVSRLLDGSMLRRFLVRRRYIGTVFHSCIENK